MKILHIILLILCFTNYSAWSKTFRVGDFEYETIKKGLLVNEVKLKKDCSHNPYAQIPETVTHEGTVYKVGIIDNNAFKDNKNISSVLVPGSVHLLNFLAFKNLKSLKNVTFLPATDELKSAIVNSSNEKSSTPQVDLAIGFSAFANCENIEALDFSKRKTFVMVPKNLYGTKAWGISYPFENCKSLKSVIFSDVVFSDDGLKIFKGCHSLENIVTSTVNPSRFKKLFEPDCPFMTKVYPIISHMSENDYIAYINNTNNVKNDFSAENVPQGEHKADEYEENKIADNTSFSVTTDIMSIPIQRKDNNGVICALLKIYCPQNNLSFEGNIIGDVEYKNKNQYWIYLTSGSQKIKINSPGSKPVNLVFMDYGIHHLDSKRIYEYSYEGNHTQKLNIVYTPDNAIIIIDGVIYDGEKGLVDTFLPLGEHTYIIAAKGYVSVEGVIKLKSQGPTKINVDLIRESE